LLLLLPAACCLLICASVCSVLQRSSPLERTLELQLQTSDMQHGARMEH
jgi:hypothetical protein